MTAATLSPPAPPKTPLPNLIPRTGDEPEPAALVLSGGGANAAFQVGVLDALAGRFRWTSVYGVSSGALNAVLIGQDRLDELRRLWWEEAESLVKRRRAWSFIWGLLFGATGVYDNERLRKRVRELVEEAPFAIPTFAGTVNLKTSDYRLAAHHERDFAESVIASTSIPLLFDQPPSATADGGLRNSTPLADAIDAGHERIVVISNRLRALPPESDLKGFVSIFGRTMEILLHEIAENDIRQCARINYLVRKAGGAVNGYRSVDLKVIRPSQDLGNMLDFSAAHVEDSYFVGVMDGRRYLRGV